MRKVNLTIPRYKPVEEKLLAEARLNEGEIYSIDSADLAGGALTNALNTRVRLDKTSRRPGKISEAPIKPNSNKILGVFLFKKNDASTHFFRFTRNSIHKRQTSSWLNYTAGVGGSLTGTDKDYYSTAVVLNKFFFANGVDKIQELDTAAPTFKEAGANSPKVRYVTGFFNRVIGAYRVEGSEPDGPVTIVGSADRDSSKWINDASPDVSCFQTPLVESPSDLADFITGVFGGPSLLLIAREKSIWAATKLPSASNPLNAATALPGIGCDCPRSIKVIPGGLAWLDTRTAQVWAWNVGSTPEEIGSKVFKEIMKAVNDPSQVISGYDTVDREFSLGVPVAGTSIVRVWTYNQRTKAWVHDEIDLLSYIADIDSPFFNILSFDELIGSFNSLVGTFDELVTNAPAGKAARYYGYTNGNIIQESQDADSDDGVAYTTDIQSKDFKTPGIDTYFSEISIEYQAKKVGTIELSYSKDRGISWKTVRTIQTKLGSSHHIIYRKCVVAHNLRWRITSSNGLFDILNYEIKVMPSGEQKEGD